MVPGPAGLAVLAGVGEGEGPAVREAAGNAVRAAAGHGATHVDVHVDRCFKEAAEGCFLGSHRYDMLKTEFEDAQRPRALAVEPVGLAPLSPELRTWNDGRVAAIAQCFVRRLAETPSNIMTPTQFCNEVQAEFTALAGCKLTVRDKAWIQEQGMESFLAVSQGSDEPPRFLEVVYTGIMPRDGEEDPAPVVIVGKGITFDSGGISLKPGAGMGDMRADMMGAAVAVGVVLAAARLQAPVNLVALTPLCENMPSGHALKPGDVIHTRKGLSVEVDNTDAEGRLILADALDYAAKVYRPVALLDVATLTGAIDVALGQGAAGVFSTSDELASELKEAGKRTAEPLWPMPLFPVYFEQIKSSYADIRNVGGKGAGACTAAAFLAKFVPKELKNWAHIDIAGVMMSPATKGSQVKGMSGRPLRAILDWVLTHHTRK